MSLAKTFVAATGFTLGAAILYKTGTIPSFQEAASFMFAATSGFVTSQITECNWFRPEKKKDNNSHQSDLNL
jgi:hypothetical protein